MNSEQYDPNMTEEEELEWLKRKYGFNNMDRASKAEINLENALKWKKIDYKTYNEQKESLKNDLDSVFDSNITRSTGVIEMINGMNLSKWMEKRYLCSYCEHYGTGLIDGGYGCGYRNTQMLLSSIRADPRLKDALFNNSMYIFYYHHYIQISFLILSPLSISNFRQSKHAINNKITTVNSKSLATWI